MLISLTITGLPLRIPERIMTLFLSSCLTCGNLLAQEQIIYTAEFTRMLDELNLSYAEPAEQWLHVTLPPEHDYMDYNLVLENDREDFELRYRFRRADRRNLTPPAVEVAGLVASISSNDPETEILIQIPADAYVREAFNADSGIVARFTPKADFSEKQFGALISLFLNDGSGVDVVLLYQDQEYDPVQMFRSIRFRDGTNDKYK